MKLHKNIKLFKEAISITSQRLNISEIYIEKDYWLTYALYTIFSNEIGKETVFKGGLPIHCTSRKKKRIFLQIWPTSFISFSNLRRS